MLTQQVLKTLICLALFFCNDPLLPQRTAGQLQNALVGQPLYLRGFWDIDKLEFDPDGRLRTVSEPGPLTLCGIDVLAVFLKGKNLIIHGRRVALIANTEGRLERRPIFSTTILFGSLRRSPNNKFFADQEVTVLVHPDSAGAFDTALKTIFVNGLAELASVAPHTGSVTLRPIFLPI